MNTKRKKKSLIIGISIAALILVIIIAATYFNIGPAARCELPADGFNIAGTTAHSIESAGIERCYFLFTPDDYDPSVPVPLIISYHGFLSNPNSQAMITGWNQLAEEENFLVVYPQGKKFPQRWNSGSTWTDSDVDDVQFFRDILDDVAENRNFDPSRVYVNGFSNGGGMTVLIGCEEADRVAAAGTVAAAVVEWEDCAPSRPLPMIAFHGTGDPVVNYDGLGMQYELLRFGSRLTKAPSEFIGAEEWTARWASANNCNPIPEEIPVVDDVSGVEYVECDEDAGVMFYTIDGGGHTWPGGFPILITGKTSNTIDATREMWDFFQNYSLDQ